MRLQKEDLCSPLHGPSIQYIRGCAVLPLSKRTDGPGEACEPAIFFCTMSRTEAILADACFLKVLAVAIARAAK